MIKFNLNQPIAVTKKSIIIFSGLTILLILFTIISFVFSLSNRSQISRNYQMVENNFNEIKQKVNASNTMMDNINALEQRIKNTEIEQKKITLDYDNLNTRTARHEQDIFFLQTVVNDKNLDSRLDNIEVSLANREIDIDSIKMIQQTQQNSIDSIANKFIEFKSQIIQKVTTMLSEQKNAAPKTITKNSSVSQINNFPYILSSIEYRSSEKWAVFAPKNVKSLSELKLLTTGDMIDNWKITQIDDKSVKMINGKQIYTLTVAQ